MESHLKNHSSANIKDAIRLNKLCSPEEYRTFRAQNETDNVLFLERYKTKIKWNNCGDRCIDLGCGDGGMTSILEKHLPPNFETLVGCDLNPAMVEFASEHSGTERVSFHQTDIEGDLPEEWREGFHHVFSFYTLHWIRNQQKAFQNIFDFLTENGDCLLVLVARHPIYDLFLALSATEKWSPHLRNINGFLSPYYYCQEPDVKVSEMMKGIGFGHVDVRCKQMIATNSLDLFIGFVMSIQPFDIPNELMEQFLEDVNVVLRELRLVQGKSDGFDGETVLYNYNLLVVHAAK